MMYPIFVLTVTLVVGVGIAWFILPRLVTVFSQLGLELPTATRLLIATGEFLGEYGAIAMPIFLLIVFIVIIQNRIIREINWRSWKESIIKISGDVKIIIGINSIVSIC